ncbi:MAG TPA: hypothetical protein VIL26_08800 [Clostridia bacterium]
MKNYIKLGVEKLNESKNVGKKDAENSVNFFVKQDYKANFSEELELDSKEIEQDIEYLLPFTQGFEKKSNITKSDKKRTILSALIIEIVLTLFFGMIGIPAIFKKEKLHGFIMMVISAISLFVLLEFHFWYLLIIVGILYVWEVTMSISRIVLYLRGNKYFKEYNNFQTDDNYSYTELI